MGEITEKTGVLLEYYNKDCWRIFIAGDLRGFANRMANGGWCVFGTDDRRIGAQHFNRPLAAGKWLLAHLREPGNEH